MLSQFPASIPLLALALAAGVTFGSLPVLIRQLVAWGLVDRPDANRKLHARAVPVGGGLAVFAGVAAGVLPMLWLYQSPPQFTIVLLIASGMLTAIGLADDAWSIRGRQKLILQTLVAVFVVFVGPVGMSGLEVFDIRISLGVFGSLFAILWIVGTINAVNLLDGADGVATVVGITLGGALVVLCLLLGKAESAVVPAAMVGGLLAFLPFNKPPARVFLGDTGSQLIGLVLGASALQASLKGPTAVALTGIVAIWAVPIFDMAIAVLRRRLTGRSLYAPDRGHLHHCLMDRGLSGNWLLLIVGTACLLTAAGAVISVAAENELFAIAGVICVIGTLVYKRLFGHSEASLAVRKSVALAKSVVRRPKSKRLPYQWESPTLNDSEWQALWTDLLAYGERFGLTQLRLDVNVPSLREDYSASWKSPLPVDPNQLWTATVPLYAGGRAVGSYSVAGHLIETAGSEEVAMILSGLTAFERQIADQIDSIADRRRHRQTVTLDAVETRPEIAATGRD